MSVMTSCTLVPFDVDKYRLNWGTLPFGILNRSHPKHQVFRELREIHNFLVVQHLLATLPYAVHSSVFLLHLGLYLSKAYQIHLLV